MTLNVFALKADESAVKESVIHKPLINHVICTLMMTLNAFTLKADKSAMKKNVIHKPLINHIICTPNDDTEYLCIES